MAHTSEKRWADTISPTTGRTGNVGISPVASDLLKRLINILNEVEEGYQQMQEIYTYAGGTATDLAELLFKEDIAARNTPDNVASAEEIAKATDLVNAMTSAHEVYQSADNVIVAQEDRLTDMRRLV